MYTCAECAVRACCANEPDRRPKNCPANETERMDTAFSEYFTPEVSHFYITCTSIMEDMDSYWPRLKKTVQFCKDMGYHTLGLAFCKGVSETAAFVARVLRKEGFRVESIICKTGGYSKEQAGIPEEKKACPGGFDAMCNPIAQAEYLNSCNTEFNIEVGLCVGHDSLFYKYSKAMVTTLVAKNPYSPAQPSAPLTLRPDYASKREELL